MSPGSTISHSGSVDLLSELSDDRHIDTEHYEIVRSLSQSHAPIRPTSLQVHEAFLPFLQWLQNPGEANASSSSSADNSSHHGVDVPISETGNYLAIKVLSAPKNTLSIQQSRSRELKLFKQLPKPRSLLGMDTPSLWRYFGSEAAKDLSHLSSVDMVNSTRPVLAHFQDEAEQIDRTLALRQKLLTDDIVHVTWLLQQASYAWNGRCASFSRSLILLVELEKTQRAIESLEGTVRHCTAVCVMTERALARCTALSPPQVATPERRLTRKTPATVGTTPVAAVDADDDLEPLEVTFS